MCWKNIMQSHGRNGLVSNAAKEKAGRQQQSVRSYALISTSGKTAGGIHDGY